MPIDNNFSELERLILNQTEYIEKGIPGQLASLVGEIQQKLIKGGELRSPFKTRTGNLRRSMQTTLEDYGLSISMLNYGYFLSFGVNGKNRANALGLPPDVATAFGVGEGYMFGQNSTSDRVYGINPFGFYDNDIEDKLIEILTNNG